MPNIKSAIKRVKTTAKETVVNNNVNMRTKTSIKKVVKDSASEEKLTTALKNIDKSVSSKLIHKNKAARLKSRLTKMVNNAKETK